MTLRDLVIPMCLPVVLSGCVLEADPGEEPSEITDAIQDDIVGELEALGDDVAQVQTYLCRRGDASDGIYSLRSFDGRLCDGSYVDGLDVVGGAALLICWDANIEEFQDSGCAENALEEYGLETYDEGALIDEMIVRIDAYASEAGGTRYDVAKLLFCTIPSSLLGPGAELHASWCGA
jgi:hypothetical protein